MTPNYALSATIKGCAERTGRARRGTEHRGWALKPVVSLHMKMVGVLILLAAFSATVVAQSPVPIPADVETVVTGGFWNSASSKGTFRVVIRSGGFEHVVSQLQIDWIADPEGNDKPARVVASRLAETGSWRLTTPRISKGSNGWRVTVDGVEPHMTPQVRGTWIVQLGEPGSLKTTLRQR